MKKILTVVFILLVIGFVVLQFFQPEKNLETTSADDLFSVEKVPADVELILKNSCYDCHSNHTRYLWYHHISPVSWMVNNHIQEGKHKLNLSEWGKMDVYDKITSLEEMSREAKRKAMPLKSYLIMHPKAKLNKEQIELLEKWTSELGEELLKKSAE